MRMHNRTKCCQVNTAIFSQSCASQKISIVCMTRNSLYSHYYWLLTSSQCESSIIHILLDIFNQQGLQKSLSCDAKFSKICLECDPLKDLHAVMFIQCLRITDYKYVQMYDNLGICFCIFFLANFTSIFNIYTSIFHLHFVYRFTV